MRLVKDAEPSWWEDDELLDGFPRPQQVKEWWEGSKGVDSVDSERTASEKPIDKPNTPTSEEVDTKVDVSTQLSMSAYDNENPIDKPNKNGRGDASSVSIDSLKNSTGLKEGVTDFGTYFYED